MAQITANFSDRDSANLALMRLRRGGIDFSLIKMTTKADEGAPQSTQSYPICFGKIGGIATTSITCPQSKGSVYPEDNKTEMKISVKANQLHKAEEIMQNAGAYEISSL